MTTRAPRQARHATRRDTAVASADVARVLGVTLRTVQRLVQAGVLPAPVARGRFDLAAAVQSYVAHRLADAHQGGGGAAGPLGELRRRKLALEIATLELALGERKRALVDMDRAARVVADEYAACRARLLTVPTKCAPLVAPIAETETCRAILHDAIEDALRELSSEEALGEHLGDA